MRSLYELAASMTGCSRSRKTFIACLTSIEWTSFAAQIEQDTGITYSLVVELFGPFCGEPERQLDKRTTEVVYEQFMMLPLGDTRLLNMFMRNLTREQYDALLTRCAKEASDDS